MEMIQKLHDFITAATRITVSVHMHPDGDALGSGLALVRFLTGVMGKDAVLALPDSIPETLSFMSMEDDRERVIAHSEDPEKAERRIASSDLLFCLDCNAFSRTAALEDALRASTAPKVLVDHHLNPDTESFDLVFSKTEVSSASEVLFWTLLEMEEVDGDAGRLPDGSIQALMTGLTTDTNNFANSVFPSTLEMASRLLEAGADRDGILSSLYNSYRENRLRLMGFMLGERMKITPDGVACMILDRKTQERFDFRQGETEGFVNMPLAIQSVRMSIFLTEEEDRFRVSVRSKKGTSANMFARTYCNGGGHEQAAGGKLLFPQDIESPDAAEEYILSATSKFFSR